MITKHDLTIKHLALGLIGLLVGSFLVHPLLVVVCTLAVWLAR